MTQGSNPSRKILARKMSAVRGKNRACVTSFASVTLVVKSNFVLVDEIFTIISMFRAFDIASKLPNREENLESKFYNFS